jgi:hypothetical protein
MELLGTSESVTGNVGGWRDDQLFIYVGAERYTDLAVDLP